MARIVALAIALIAMSPGATGQVADLPRVLILTTGGTIASRQDAPLIEGPVLIQAVPELLSHARIEVEEFSVIGSSKMTPSDWLGLSQRINRVYAGDEGLSGIVITHGTDTLEETAWFLNLTIRAERPVVLTGSMRSSDEVSADGPANLINAVRVAANESSAGQGVLAVLNENITAARDVRKTDNRRVDTFDGGARGHIGSVDPDGVEFFHRVLQPHTFSTEFLVDTLAELPEVPLITDYTGLDSSRVADFAAPPIDGLVVRTFPGGRMSAGMLEGLASIAKRSIPVVITSRVTRGGIVSPPDYPFPAVVAAGLADNKARILLMLALTRTDDIDEIRRIFDTY